MQIVEIEDPDSGSDQAAGELIVGIDFGTTNSLIALSRDSNVQFFQTDSGSDLLPSIVCRGSKPEGFIVGRKTDAGCIRSVKRLMAKSYREIVDSSVLSTLVENGSITEIDDIPYIKFNDDNSKEHTIISIASEIFNSLKKSAIENADIIKQYVDKDVILKAVISVPAYFNDAERGQVMLAAKNAGIDVLRLIPEPTAAAYAYGLNKGAQGTYLVYDLGGGTFDVSILDMSEGVLQVIACGGDNNLGGDDIDFAISEYLISRYADDHDIKMQISPQLLAKAKRLKEELSQNDNSIVDINGQELSVNINEIDQVILGFIDKTIKIAKDVYFDAEEPELDGIILVGGSTRIPLIQSKLLQSFSAKIYNSMDPDRAVACGAALQAENLSTSRGNLLIDVVPLSVGLELYGGLFEKIILRNTPLPFSTSKEFTTHADYQTGMNFHVLQGEREMSSDCRSLAHFELKGLPSQKAGMVKVSVDFAMDADGILSVTASEVDSGKAVNITCRPGYGLTEKQIADDLDNAYANAALDHEQRLMLETKIEAQELISGLKGALAQTPDIISDIEYNEINARIGALEKAVSNISNIDKPNIDDRNNILGMMQELNSNATKFIEKHLNFGADKIIVGKNIKDLEK